ncbi:hypothetical protein [Streptomyces sp. AM 2-1-1]|uniref:hypothetical protein n=1 Tax=Streptomyces sp. AM 2-1-1 TaxID=3028709 RepID=UPI0023BA1042|nr:hypothetical protein [Streptomyces sp. AM 2-1-1]WEH42796.1 hypothetical protein PZB77_26685 [Streptomyces sp. AM 2-1-1]
MTRTPSQQAHHRRPAGRAAAGRAGRRPDRAGPGRPSDHCLPHRSPRRAVAARLHRAPHAAREAADHQRATGGTGAVEATVPAGAGREPDQALVALVRGSAGARSTVPLRGEGGLEGRDGLRRLTGAGRVTPGRVGESGNGAG